MSLDFSAGRTRSAVQPGIGAADGLIDTLPLAVTIGSLLAAALTIGKAVAVWRTGIFYGPDDAMRAVEVRDFLAGQGWFDLVPRRLSPGHPFAMHWSRLADVPLAGLMLAFRQVTDPATAERLTRLVEPASFYVAYLALLTALARDLCGRRGALAVALLAAGALDVIGDFMPGRIHHHALQILLLVLMTKLVCDGLDAARPGRLAWAGIVASLSLAINLQNMPFVAATAIILAGLWALRDPGLAAGLGRFGLGLASGAVAVELAQVPPSHYLAGTCDAFGAPHLLAAVLGGVSLALTAGLSGRLRTPAARCAALGISGVAIVLALYVAYPACLGDPYAGVDPLVRSGWMAEVGEAMPLVRLLERDPYGTVPIVLALLSGLGAIGAALCLEEGLARSRWTLILGLALVALAGAVWQNRVAASGEVFAALGGAWLLCRLFVARIPAPPFATLLAVVTGLALTPAGLTAAATLVGPDPARPPGSGTALDPVDQVRCFEPSSYDGLARLPPGLVLSLVDPGAHILAYTAQSAIAAPYHRDTAGIRLALEAFGASPQEARRLVVEDAKADYVALCTASPEVHEVVRQEPDGFAARILSGRLPSWLVPLDAPGAFRIYAVRPEAAGPEP